MTSKQPRNPRNRTFCSLLLLVLGLLTSSPLLAASPGSGLPCDFTFPGGTLWSDYFATSGRSLTIDDECGMETPVSSPLAVEGETWVSFEIPFAPHQIRYDMFLETESSNISETEVAVFQMTHESGGMHIPVVELRLTSKALLKTVILSDNDEIVLQEVSINPAGFHLSVELTKSVGEEVSDGRVRLFVDGQEARVASNLKLWDRLPTSVRLGVVKVYSNPWSADRAGTLRFQPAGFSHNFFSYSPR